MNKSNINKSNINKSNMFSILGEQMTSETESDIDNELEKILDDDKKEHSDDQENNNNYYSSDDEDNNGYKKFPSIKYKVNKFNKIKFQKKDTTIRKKYNHKKILCNNYILNNTCQHGSKCSYAHNLEEQNIDAYRQKTLDILNSNEDLSYIDFTQFQYKILMKDLLTYTKICENCINKKCTGGYNCKYGTCLEKYLICYDDLNYNHCTTKNCEKIHLSKRNLKPILNKIYYTIDNHIRQNLTDINTSDNNLHNINTENKNNILETDNKKDSYITNSYILDTLNSIILLNKINNNDNGYDDSSSDDDCDKSIFIDKIDKIILDNDDKIIIDSSDNDSINFDM